MSIYKHSHKHVVIICKKHGEFLQTPSIHLSGHGCPKCKTSKGELAIAQYLIENKTNFIWHKKFDDCINPNTNNKLIFDFYIPNKNTCIEFDGQLHFISVPYFGGEKALIKIQFRDNIKNEYCKNNKINIIRISNIADIQNKLYSIINA